MNLGPAIEVPPRRQGRQLRQPGPITCWVNARSRATCMSWRSWRLGGSPIFVSRMKALPLLLIVSLLSSADPYADWSQGRPAEAVAPLISQAQFTGRWDAWLDAGLAAAAANRRGDALACLALEHNAAPERREPRDGLRLLGAPLPTTWCERAGPIGLPGYGWAGVVLLAVAGLALGTGVARRRTWLLVGGGLLIVVAAPGVIAMHLDGAQPWVCAVRDTQALDSTGAPLRSVPEGTLLRSSGRTWNQRSAVALPDGQACWVPTVDLTPRGTGR